MGGRWRGGRCRSGARLAVVGLLASLLVVQVDARAATAGPTESLATSKFVPAGPVRIADTRPGEGPVADGVEGLVAPGGVVRIDVAAALGVAPSAMTAAVLNVTVTETVRAGYVQVLPGDAGTLGASSSLNFDGAGATMAGLVTAPVGADGTVRVLVHSGGHVVVDAFGWFTPSGPSRDGRLEFVPPPSPRRMLDTRARGGLVPAGGTVVLPLAVNEVHYPFFSGGPGMVGRGFASAVVLNVTVTEATGPGFWQVVPTGGATPLGGSSNLNVTRAGQTIANQVIVPVGADGSVTIFSQSGGHVVVDAIAYFTSDLPGLEVMGLFVPMEPTRVFDTRDPLNGPVAGPLGIGETMIAPIGGRKGVPAGARMVAMNVTIVDAAGPGWVQVTPKLSFVHMLTSTVNAEFAGQTISNGVYMGLGEDQAVLVKMQHGGHLVGDVTGWFTSDEVFSPSVVPPRATLPVDAPRFAFVGTRNEGVPSGSAGISTFRFDPSTGAMTHVATTPAIDPTALALHPNGRVLYVTSERAPVGALEAYSIDAATGALTLLDRREVGADPVALAVHPAGTVLATANAAGGSYTSISLDADGSFGWREETLFPYQGQVGPTRPADLIALARPSGTSFMYADAAAGSLGGFGYSGSRIRGGGAGPAALPGAGPSALTVPPRGDALYILNEVTSSVALSPISTSSVGWPMHRAPLAAPNEPSGRGGRSLLVSPDGRFLYASHRSDPSLPNADRIVRFEIDPIDAQLTRVGVTTTGVDGMVSMVFDPSATWVYAVNHDGDSIVQFTIDAVNGELVPTGHTVSTRLPIGMVITP